MPFSKNANQALVFDLSFDSILDAYIPSAFIVEQMDGVLLYSIKIANTKTIAEFNLELDRYEQQLLTICDKLTAKSILTKYKVKNKMAKSLEILVSEAKTKKIVSHFVNFSLESFFKIISSTNIPLAINLNKKDVFHKQQVFFSNTILEPKLHFSKTPENIVYQLSLFDNETELFPFEHDFKILLNEPSWITYYGKIYTINHINGNKLKPFLTKKEVIIPNKNSVEYFNKFIKNVIKKVPIDAEGFTVETNTNCKGCVIKPTLHFQHKVYLLELVFIYENCTFSNSEAKTKHITLSHNDLDEFTVHQTIRNKKEENRIRKTLESFGFIFQNDGFLTFNENVEKIDEYFNITTLLKIKNEIISEEISINLELGTKKINTHTSTIQLIFPKIRIGLM
ncbi:MAG: hypothetical protein HC854_07185 [Flavobacterium sp.]|nr:hypothetical protein [Flavobacterium sp.]